MNGFIWLRITVASSCEQSNEIWSSISKIIAVGTDNILDHVVAIFLLDSHAEDYYEK
jgi:hypothetical protein